MVLEISARHLARSFGSVRAVADVSIGVPHGSIYGLLGPNGAGKTTLLRMLLGLLRSDAGQVEVFGEPLRPSPDVFRRIGAAIDLPALYPNLSGVDNLRVFAATRGMSERETRRRIADLLDIVGLDQGASRRTKTYSTGMRQRLALAVALLPRPDLLVFDEPTSGLDPEGVADVRAVLAGVAAEGATILLSSHALSEVERLCDRITIVKAGRVVLEGEVATLLDRDGRFVVSCATEEENDRVAALLSERGYAAEHQRERRRVAVVTSSENAPQLSRASSAAYGFSSSPRTFCGPTWTNNSSGILKR